MPPQGTSNPSYDPQAAAGTAGSVDPTLSQQQPAAQTAVTPPPTALQPGATGQDVSQLQNYLVQMGYLTPEQVGTGSGTYGPQTTAAVAKLQKDLGVQTGGAAGYYGPKTQAALSQKYQGIFKSVQSTQAPDQAGAAKQQIQQQIQDQNQPSSDPVFGAMSSALAPIMGSLTQVLNNINNPALTAVSLQQEYNQLASQYGLPGMQADMLNMQNVMNGTESDIRDEISKAGGTATESQIMGMTAARNKVILKQYNALATQYQAAQTNVQNMMQYATTDQQTQMQKEQMTASVTESMASIESQMMTMGMTMQQNANSNLNKVVTNIGYTGLAAQAGGDPNLLSSYEKTLGLAPGALSDPVALKQMETYRQQQLQMSQQKIVLQYGNMPGQPTTPTPGSDSNGLIPTPSSSPSGANGGDILSATGMSVQAFNYLTQGTPSMSRFTPAQRNQIMAEATAWLKKNNVDISTFQSQYTANNTTLSSNISRFNNTQIAEGEVTGTLSNMDTAAVSAGLGSVNIENVGKVLVGQQVNDPAANEYAFYFNDLKNSLAYFYAAQQGKASPDVVDNQDAANVIVGGLSKGGVKGLQTAVTNTTAKMKTVLSTAVDNARQNVWNLFGVGDKYQSPNRPIKVQSPDGKQGTIPASQLQDALANGYTQI